MRLPGASLAPAATIKGSRCSGRGWQMRAAGAFLNAQNLAPLWDRPVGRRGLVYGRLNRPGDGYYYLGRSFMLQDEDEKAIASLERALKIIGASTPRGQLVQAELNTLKNRKR